MAGAEGSRRQEDREGARRVFDEHVPIGQRPVQELLGIALVDVQVAEPRRPEQAAVGDGASRQENRNRDDCGAQRHPHAATPAEAGEEDRVGGGGATGGGGGGGSGVAGRWAGGGVVCAGGGALVVVPVVVGDGV